MDKAKALQIANALVSLIDGWNEAGEREDRGRPNDGLCLVLFDDGSGKLGTFRPICGGNHDEIRDLGYDDVMNVQHSFESADEFAAYLADWCDEREPYGGRVTASGGAFRQRNPGPI